jgi:Protein of unknown function (DUF3047)
MNLKSWLLLISTATLTSCGGLIPTATSDLPSSGADSSWTGTHESAAWQRAAGELLQTPSGGDGWHPMYLPGKRFVGFEATERQGRPSLSVKADRSVSILRQRFAPSLTQFGQLAFSWKVDALPEGANLREADNADAAVRVVLAFDGDRSKWSPRTHRLSEMSRLLTGEELPYATLVYVWSNHGEPGSVIVNPRTDRIRKLVVESGAGQVGHWRDYRRDVRADFIKVFGEEPGSLVAVALMTDTDNTKTRLRAWYGPLTLESR